MQTGGRWKVQNDSPLLQTPNLRHLLLLLPDTSVEMSECPGQLMQITGLASHPIRLREWGNSITNYKIRALSTYPVT
jgi:hypothetical protein